MKKLLSLLVCVLLGAPLVGCRDDADDIETKKTQTTQQKTRIALDEAVENALMFISELEECETGATRAVGRRFASVEYVTSKETSTTCATRSVTSDEGNADTLLYLINYADNGGFALMPADRRLDAVYALSNEGSLSMSDTTYNKGLAMVMNSIRRNLSIPPIPFKPEPDIPEDKIQLYRSVARKINTNVAKWGQSTPYNQACPIDGSNGERSVVGCGPLACAIITSYYEYPTQFENTSIAWSHIKSGDTTEIATLAQYLHWLGEPQRLAAFYGSPGGLWGGTSIYDGNIIPAFNNIGYQDVDSDTTLFSLYDRLQNQPVLISANGPDGNGHVWVIDGAKEYVRYSYLSPEISNVEDITPGYYYNGVAYRLYHCVWGWYGKCNGYFRIEDWRDAEFNLSDGQDSVDSDEDVHSANLSFDRNYNLFYGFSN